MREPVILMKCMKTKQMPYTLVIGAKDSHIEESTLPPTLYRSNGPGGDASIYFSI